MYVYIYLLLILFLEESWLIIILEVRLLTFGVISLNPHLVTDISTWGKDDGYPISIAHFQVPSLSQRGRETR